MTWRDEYGVLCPACFAERGERCYARGKVPGERVHRLRSLALLLVLESEKSA